MSQNTDNNNIIVVKISARSYIHLRYISILVFLDKEKSEIVDMVCGISNNIYFANETDAFKDWVSIEKAMRLIENLIVDVHLRIITSIEMSVKKVLTKEVIDSILLYELNNDRKAVILFFNKEIKALLEDQATLIDVYFEQTQLNNMIEQKNKISSYVEENEYLTNIPNSKDDKVIQTAIDKIFSKIYNDEYVMIKSDFAFAPVSGTPITMLNIDDTIIVKINVDEIGEEFIENIGGSRDIKNNFYKAPATIVEKFINNNSETVVLVKLADGVYSKIIETEHIRVLTLDKEYNDNNIMKKSKVEVPKWFANTALFFLIWLICFIIVAIYLFT